MIHASIFELDSIQSYLFSSGRLRDVAGASELLDQLTEGEGNLLDQVARAVDISDKIDFPRRAGGAFYAFTENKNLLGRFLDLWTLAMQQQAPGVAFSLGIGKGERYLDAFDAARNDLRADNGRERPCLPLAAPVAGRSRRTGLAAVDWADKDGPVDAGTVGKKRFTDLAKAGFLKRFAPDEVDIGWRDWPTDFESTGKARSFPFRNDDRTVALIHADGNGLGSLLLKIRDAVERNDGQFVNLYQAFSRVVVDVTKEAAREATRKVLLPARSGDECLPARPILLGGDDVTVIVRGDLAIDYCRVFAEAFEQASVRELDALREKTDIDDLPARLSLGIGVVFLRASQPFHMAIHLAEALTGEAKKTAKRHDKDDPDSSLAFYRVTGSLVDDYDSIVERALTHEIGGRKYIDTLGTYFLSDSSNTPRLDDLLALAKLLGADDMARGPTRQLMTLMGHSKTDVKRRYGRWRRLMAARNDERARLDDYDHLMRRLSNIDEETSLPYGADDSAPDILRSPLGDALALIGVARGNTTTGAQTAKGKVA